MDVYRTWKSDPHLPLECLINAVLLYTNERDVVQFDMTYYDLPSTRRAVVRFATWMENRGDVVLRRDTSGNIVVYSRNKATRIECALRQLSSDGTVEGGFHTEGFTHLLDAYFYVCKGTLRNVLKHPNIIRASIEVIDPSVPARAGALLVQMCYPTSIDANVQRIYRRFARISRTLARIDPALQTSLTLYTKPGMWKASPELVTRYPTHLS